jgi:hypothetical protein
MPVITNSTKTLAELREHAYFLMSESNDSHIFDNASVDRAINMGLANVVKLINRQPTTVITYTINGETDYRIPDPMLQQGRAMIDSVVYDGAEIQPIEPFEREAGEAPGAPETYSVEGPIITFYPTPDAPYEVKIQYRQEHRPLVLDTDNTALTDSALDCAVLYAVYILKLKDEEFDSANLWKAEYEDAMKRINATQTGLYKAAQVMYGGAV